MTISDEKLLPCPFCGGDATLNHGATDDFDVACRNRNCFGPRTGGYVFSSDAIAAWNRRATPAGVTAQRQGEATEIAELIAWLRKRARPDSAIHYGDNSIGVAVATLFGYDAAFVAEHFHGYGAARLADALTAVLRPPNPAPRGSQPDLSATGEGECATDGCNRVATERFEAGGVGSAYCHECADKVRVVATPTTKSPGASGEVESALRDEVERLNAGALRLRMEAHKVRADALQAKLDEAKAVLEPIADALGMAEWASPEHAEEILGKIIAEHYGPARTFLTEHIDGDVLDSAGESNTSEPGAVNGGLRGERQARASGGGMSEHVLKTLDLYFDAIERGDKTFEVRRNDRAFQTGDVLVLTRYENLYRLRPTVPLRSLRKRITYLLQGGQFGIEPGYCVLGLGDPTND